MINTLPDDCLYLIISFLDDQEKLLLARVSRQFKELVYNDITPEKRTAIRDRFQQRTKIPQLCGILFNHLHTRKDDTSLKIEGQKIIDYYRAKDYIIALTENGKLYSKGSAETAQLGLGKQPGVLFFEQIKGPLENEVITKLVALENDGHTCIVAISNTKKLFAWGNIYLINFNNITQEREMAYAPTLINLPDIPVDITINSNSTVLFIICRNSVYACGDNSNGNLGLGHTDKISGLQQIPALYQKNIIAISASSHHVLALTDKEVLYFWGQDTHGELFDQKNTFEPNFVNQAKGTGIDCGVVAIYTSEKSSTLLLNNGELRHCGVINNDGVFCSTSVLIEYRNRPKALERDLQEIIPSVETTPSYCVLL